MVDEDTQAQRDWSMRKVPYTPTAQYGERSQQQQVIQSTALVPPGLEPSTSTHARFSAYPVPSYHPQPQYHDFVPNATHQYYQQWYHQVGHSSQHPSLRPNPLQRPQRPVKRLEVENTRQTKAKTKQNRHQTKHKNGKGWKRKRVGSRDPDLFIHPRYYLAAQSSGNTPEEVSKWIEERRKKFPKSERRDKESKPTEEHKQRRTISKDASTSKLGEEGEEPSSKPEAYSEKKLSIFCQNSKVCYRFVNGSCNRGNFCKYSHDKALRAKKLIQRRKTAEREAYLRAVGRSKGQTSLLRKLLMKDIKQEEFILMEMVRFLCNENFFQ